MLIQGSPTVKLGSLSFCLLFAAQAFSRQSANDEELAGAHEIKCDTR